MDARLGFGISEFRGLGGGDVMASAPALEKRLPRCQKPPTDISGGLVGGWITHF